MKKGKYIRGTFIGDDSPTPSGGVGGVMLSDNGDSFLKRYLPIILIVLLTAIVYSFSFDNHATNWDDEKYTEQSTLLKKLDKETVWRMFTSDDPDERYCMGNYHPLTMLTLNIDYHFSEKQPNGKVYPIRFIVVNVLLHLMSCVILYILCLQLFSNRLYPIVIALLFGIHTLHVESVTWISERKDVLYTMFYFLSLYLYILYRRRNNVMFYILSAIIFILSALSKGQAVFLTATLFIVDYLILENYPSVEIFKRRPGLLLDKIPFIVISLVFGFISIKAQAASTALAETDQYELWQRIPFGSNGFFQYIWRFILPVHLANLYPYPDIIHRTVPVLYWLTVPIFVSLILVNFFIYKKNKIVTFGLTFFIANIFMLLQFIPVGSAMYSDRYIYIPSVGLSVLIAYLLAWLCEKYSEKRNLFYIIFSIYGLLLCYLTVQREKVWHDSLTLWTDCVSKYPEAVIGWNNLGTHYNMLADSLYKNTDDNKYVEYKKNAIQCFTEGVKYKPDYTNAFFNRGKTAKDIYDFNGDTAYLNSAFSDFNTAVVSDLKFAPAFHSRAMIYDSRAEEFMGVNDDSAKFYTNLAIFDFNRALELEPTMYEVYINRGTTYGKSGNFAKSIEDFNFYETVHPESPALYSNRGLAYNGLKDYDNALKNYEKCLEIDSLYEGALFNRSITYRSMGDSLSDRKYYMLAADDLSKCIQISPNKASYYYLRGVCYLVADDRVGACSDLHEASRMHYTPADALIQAYCNGK
ncbi:MAG: hypothetical protein J5595_11395 [Bacteroidales bacterium]|nr:hypothetical protein [Bacteroidales bacterium]